MANTKEQLRRQLKIRRQKLTAAEVKDLSNFIAVKCLENINWHGIKYINVYTPIKKNHELDPTPLLAALKSGLPYLKVTVQSNSPHQRPRASAKYDAIIVPMLGFDKRGYRLGTGGGFYDKFLAKQPRALKIGLCYEQGLIEDLPTEPHDLPLDIIITEGIIISRDSHRRQDR